MNENIDLTKILKDCPNGFELYSTLCGTVLFRGIHNRYSIDEYPVKCECDDGQFMCFTKEGCFFDNYNGAECVIFPSKDQRDWSKFTAPWYKKLIEPKFNIGQYITDGYVVGQITGIEDEYHCYKILDFMGGISTTIPFTLQDNYHLWTIQDAKDGDVLYSFDSNQPFIYKERNDYEQATAYCGLNMYGKFFVWGTKDCAITLNNYVPATKKQLDALMKAMNDAGYKWNAETKTLEKLIQPKFKVGDRVRHKETNRDDVYEISKVYDDSYGIAGFTWMIYMKYQDEYELVTNKFDPKTLKPFDRVLLREDCDDEWACDIFSHLNETRNFVCTGSCSYVFCIPYNDETKHLVGTTDEAPEYYRYWED